MTERTKKDDAIDRAIEQLIAEDLEGFALVTVEGQDVHSVQAASQDEQFLAVYMLVEQICRDAADEGTPLKPEDVLLGAFQVADERGLLDERAGRQELL